MTSELPKNSSESAQSTEKLNHVARKRIATTMAAIAMSASALIGSGAVVDAYVSVAIDPKKEATIINHSPESCHQASFSIVYFDPTGKPVSQHLAILNKSIVDEYGGASLSLHYGDQYDIDELAEKINYVLELCEQSGKPVILSGQSLGGKIAQEVANSGKVKNVIAIFQESTPTGPEDIKSDINRKLVTSLQEVPITPGKVTMSAFSAISSVQRGKNPFEPIEMKDNQISVDETSPRVLLWQRQANAKPYPENNAPIPIYYLYSSKDEVVNTNQALMSLRKYVRGNIIPLEVSPEFASPTNYNHAESWVEKRHPIYAELYEKAIWSATWSIRHDIQPPS